MAEPLTQYLTETFSGQLNNALIISVIYALVVDDIRKWIEGLVLKSDWKIFKSFKNSFACKILLKLLAFVPALVFGLMALFLVVFFFWLMSFLP